MNDKVYKVEKATYGEHLSVSCPTDEITANQILIATVAGFKNAGYTRSNDELTKKLPDGVEILRKGLDTVAFRVVAA